MEVPKRINWFKYAGYAASILLLISVAFFINTNDADNPIEKDDVVTVPVIDATELIQPNFKNSVPQETVIVKTEPSTEAAKKAKKKADKQVVEAQKKTDLKVPNVIKENTRIVIAKHTPIEKKKTTQVSNSRIKVDSNALLLAVTKSTKKIEKSTAVIIPEASRKLLKQSKIKINSDALLYAVTNPNKDISEYYKKYHIDRGEVLRNIQKELNKVNLKIDAATLLTSVEKTIDEETFKKSFMQVVKGKITGFASAFANRNN